MEGIVGRLSKNNMLIISGKDATRESNRIDQTNDANQAIACDEIIEEAIVNRRTIATVDASIDERFMAAVWIATIAEKRGKHVNETTLTKWMKGATPEAKGLGMLNLVKEINNKTKHLTGEKIKTHSDNKKVTKVCQTKLIRKAK